MKTPQQLHALGHVVSQRAREQERLGVELARQQAVRERYRTNLERLERLCEQSGPSGAQPMALSMNCANYKQAVIGLAQNHREQLGQHEAEMAATQRALVAATQRHEALDQLLRRRHQSWAADQAVRAQKQQDEQASQVWLRGQR
ncbi:flagellar FliJ family protein [Hydrogenophaga aquatica]